MEPAAGGGVIRPPRKRTRRKLVLAGLVVALPLVVSGCGGSDSGSDGGSDGGSTASSGSEPTAAESWADDVCSTVGSWTTTIAEAQSTLSTPRDLTANEVEATFAEVRSATSTLVDGLGDLGAPDTDAGNEAEKRLASLSEELQKQADVVDDASGDQPQGMGERLDRVSTVSGAVAAMISDAQKAVADIRALDGAQELEDAFKSAASCQGLTS
jgi:hypothetical protein